MWAAAGGHASCIELLLKAGASPSVTDKQGRLPLHWAAERGRAQAAAVLVTAMAKHGVDCHLLVGLSLC
jgi:palmitoyltransferase